MSSATFDAATAVFEARGLTKVYNLMDDGGFTDLRAAHRDLDLAVLASYGFDASLLDDRPALLDRLFDLNTVCAHSDSYRPFLDRGVAGASLFDEVEALTHL